MEIYNTSILSTLKKTLIISSKCIKTLKKTNFIKNLCLYILICVQNFTIMSFIIVKKNNKNV